MTIIEQIEKLREQEDETIQGRYSQLKNDMLDSVLDILKPYFEEKDAPDDIGWWAVKEGMIKNGHLLEYMLLG